MGDGLFGANAGVAGRGQRVLGRPGLAVDEALFAVAVVFLRQLCGRARI